MDTQMRSVLKIISILALLALVTSACSTPSPSAAPAATNTSAPATSAPTSTQAPLVPNTASTEASPVEEAPTPTMVMQAPPGEGVLFEDDFTDPNSGWAQAVDFDNYFIGYHEPSFYHVEVHAANDRAVVSVPDSHFSDLTIETKVFTEPNNTAPEGDFRYGLIFRRSGGQYYAFTISPRSQTWQLLKVTPSGTQELESGKQSTIQGLSSSDTLRVDVQETAFFLWINEQLVARASDIDFSSGEIGFFVETLDSPRVHIHFDTLNAREVEVPTTHKAVLYDEEFNDSSSGWPQAVDFDNYFVGYHEPSYYHVEVHAQNDRAVVAAPGSDYTNFTLETEVFTEPNNTAAEGDFRYGLVFHRSGGQYYTYTISPRRQAWALLKVSPTGTEELASGESAEIQGLSASDTLRVDVENNNFYLWINNQLLTRVSDDTYSGGELGFLVETFDSPRVHIHFDTLKVSEAEIPQESCAVVVRGLNLRQGPGLNNDVITTIRYLEKFEPLGRSQDGQWLRVRIEEQFETGWVSNTAEYFSCSAALEDLPIQLP